MRLTVLLFLVLIYPGWALAQPGKSYAKAMGNTIMTIWKDSLSFNDGNPQNGHTTRMCILQGIQGLWNATGDGKYFNYIQKSMDFFVNEDGDIRTYKFDNLTLDNISTRKRIIAFI